MNRKYLFCFALISILALVYFLVLAYYNRPSNDDWLFQYSVKQNGLFAFISEMYFTWQGRFSSFFLTGIQLQIYNLTGSLLLNTILILLLGGFSFYLLLSQCFLSINRLDNAIIALFLLIISLFSLLEFNTFYWVCGSSYLIFAYLALYLVYFMLKERLSKIEYSLVVIISFLLSGSAETFTPIVMIAIAVIAYWHKFKFKISWSKCFYSREVLSLIILLVGFAFMIFAPGNSVRINSFERTFSFYSVLTVLIKAFAQYIVYQFPYLFVALTAIVPGLWVSKQLKLSALNMKTMVFITILLVFLIILSIVPGTIAMFALLPLRTISFLSIAWIMYFFVWGLYLGKHERSKTWVLIPLFCLLLLVCYRWSMDIRRVQKYIVALETRDCALLALKQEYIANNGLPDIVKITCLPDYKYKDINCLYLDFMSSIMSEKPVSFEYFPFIYDEISKEYDFRTEAIRKRLELPFDVVLK